jgi:hypothetical protein
MGKCLVRLHCFTDQVIVSSCVPLAVAGSMYTAFLVFKCKQRRKGSYSVHAAQQRRNPNQDSNLELGTSSTRSSFRDITAQYQRERALSDDIAAQLSRAGSFGENPNHYEPDPTCNGLQSEVASSCGLIEPNEIVPELHTSTDHTQQS